MECVVCGGVASVVMEVRTGYYRSEQVQVRSELHRCKNCGEAFFDPQQAKKHNRAIKNEIRKKYGLLSPEEIIEIRNRLNLTQSELEELLGAGQKVVVRWESGKVIQSGGHDNMLRLLGEPTVLKKLREIRELRNGQRKSYSDKEEDMAQREPASSRR